MGHNRFRYERKGYHLWILGTKTIFLALFVFMLFASFVTVSKSQSLSSASLPQDLGVVENKIEDSQSIHQQEGGNELLRGTRILQSIKIGKENKKESRIEIKEDTDSDSLYWQIMDVEELQPFYGDFKSNKNEEIAVFNANTRKPRVQKNLGNQVEGSTFTKIHAEEDSNTFTTLQAGEGPTNFTTMQKGGEPNICKLRLSVYVAPAQFASIAGQIYWTLYTPFGPTATFPGALREFVRGMTYSVQVTIKDCYGDLIAVRGDLRKTSVELLVGNVKVDVLYPYRKNYRTETPDNISIIPPYPTTVPLQEYQK